MISNITECISSLKEILSFLEKLEKPVSENIFRKTLDKDIWVKAVSEQRIGNAEIDKIPNSRAIIENLIDCSLEDKKFLNYKCGNAQINYEALDFNPKLSVGYDEKNNNWDSFYYDSRLLLTDSFEHIIELDKFDIILIYDVLDHSINPIEVLRSVASVLTDNGTIYLRCHPFCARHSLHNWNKLNKAYLQFFFTEKELFEMGLELPLQRVIYPLETYRDWIFASGLKIRTEKLVESVVEPFFKSPVAAAKIKEMYQTNDFPEEHLKIEFVDYSLKKVKETNGY